MIKSIKDNFNKELHVKLLNLIKNRNFEEASNLIDLNLTDKTRIDYKNKLKAFIFLKKQEWKTSLNFYQKISEDSLDFETLNNYGIVLFKLGHFSKAAEKFEKSLSKNKNILCMHDYDKKKQHAAWLFTIAIKKKDFVQRELRKKGIETNQVHFRNDRYSIFKKFVKGKKFPNMDYLENKYLVLPIHHKVSEKDARYISSLINKLTK